MLTGTGWLSVNYRDEALVKEVEFKKDANLLST
jgi:hypothetical protein